MLKIILFLFSCYLSEYNDNKKFNLNDLILDHDLTSEIYEKAKEVLQFHTSNWKNILNIDLISQKRLFEVIKSEQEPNLFKPEIKAPYNGHLFTNTKISKLFSFYVIYLKY